MNFDFNAITAAATAIAVFVAIYAIWAENRRSRFSHGIDLLFRMSDLFFYNKDFIRSRKKAARFLKKSLTLSKNTRKNKLKSEQLSEAELDIVLDFFEGLGMLVYRGAIDKELTYNYFSWWLECYYTLARDYINYWREEEPNYWADVEWLYQAFEAIKKKDRPSVKVAVSEAEIDVFIKHELNLK